MTDKINKICIFKFVTNTTCPLYILYWNVIAFPSNILFKPIGLNLLFANVPVQSLFTPLMRAEN